MPHIDSAEPFLLRRVKAPHVSWSRAVSAGIVAGQIGGLAMAIAMVGVFHFVLGKSPFVPFQVIGATVLGYTGGAAAADAPAALLGFLVHQLVPSLSWGIAFGLLELVVRPQRASGLVWMGLAVGALAQVIDVYIVLPYAHAHLIVEDAWRTTVHPVASWLFHLVFGMGLSFYPWKYDASAGRFV